MPKSPKPPGTPPPGGRRAREKGGPGAQLKAYLEKTSKRSAALTYHEAQGFVFTIAASPDKVDPSEWVPVVFGCEPEEIETLPESVLDDLTELYTGTLHDIADDQVSLPADCKFKSDILANFDKTAPVRHWSRGFISGHAWLEDSWELSTPDEFGEHLGATMLCLSFFSNRKLSEQALAECSDGSMGLAEVATVMREGFADSMSVYVMLGEVLREVLEARDAEEFGTDPESQSGATSASGAEALSPGTEDPFDPGTPPRKIGRNEPCPCNSGKKYKHCCALTREQFDARAGLSLRKLQQPLESKVLQFLADHHNGEEIQRTRAGFTCGDASMKNTDKELSLFYTWMFYDWIPSPEQAPGRTAAELFLKWHDADLSSEAKKFLATTFPVPFSFFQVVDVEPGSRLMLNDLTDDCDWDVFEQIGSQELNVGDVVFARVVEYEDIALIVGIGEIPLTAEFKVPIHEFFGRLRKKAGSLTREVLKGASDQLRELYFKLRDERQFQNMPQVNNTDGDPIEFHRIRCEVPSAQEAFDALATLARGVSRKQLLDAATLDQDGQVVEAEIPWYSSKKPPKGMPTRPVQGHLILSGTQLDVEVNSAQRSKRMLASLKRRLGSKMSKLSISIKTVREAMKESQAAAGTPEQLERDEALRAFQEQPEVREAMRKFREAHWQTWVDTEIPDLDGLTPRQAVKDADGRDRVRALLARFELLEPPDDPYDYDTVRRLLGLKLEGGRT